MAYSDRYQCTGNNLSNVDLVESKRRCLRLNKVGFLVKDISFLQIKIMPVQKFAFIFLFGRKVTFLKRFSSLHIF